MVPALCHSVFHSIDTQGYPCSLMAGFLSLLFYVFSQYFSHKNCCEGSEKAYFFASGPSPNEEDHVFDVFKEYSPTVQKRKKHVTQPDGHTTRPGEVIGVVAPVNVVGSYWNVSLAFVQPNLIVSASS